MNIADMAIWTYTAESTVLRVQKLAALRGADAVGIQTDIMRVYTYEAAEWMHSAGREALLSFASGDELKMMLLGLKRFCKSDEFNVKEARQRIALHLIEAGGYAL